MKKINKTNLIKFLVVAIIILGIPTLFINRIFYYTEFNSSIIVSIENTDVFNQVVKLNDISRIDKSKQEVYFERINEETLNERLSSIENNEELQISQYIPSVTTKEVLKNHAMAITIIVVSIILLSLYITQSKAKYSYKNILQNNSLFIFSVGIAVFLQLVFLSIFSRFYQVTKYDVSTILYPAIFVSLIWLLSFIKYSFMNERFEHSLINMFREKARIGFNHFFSVACLLFIPLAFALGSLFVLPAVFTIISIIFSTVAIIFVTNAVDRITLILKDRKTIQKVKTAKKEVKVSASKQKPTNKLGKNKKSKKKKNIHR